ncbi:MAG: type II toxin-antitoxin system mRNA interferase toxin, RelE/StbE family [Patescibacteria group bacterium]|nr:type II toxin-antitoxin system mRNA interferase toxin, RelE/StbE family [Patescibacteria group bacterium]MBU1349652.1 type II toxin-antitoxin system mRNA interferase toxin, RelE/StbE family [Patescibacteria group bacterium]MBU1420972.1 type II toxin-antitoxin system mRNA interferase toxin, RelE/StbE family [Patescibacteria group bacterium]MBU1987482.1 type II toxin-antitoxin system mRNA interferase toxin, RelE/StbE family [Patescibacteria group bacterium]MBU2416086.1 type II toxin-antitoxin 
MKILYLPKFTKQYKKLPNKIKKLSEIKEIIFRNNPFDPKLKTHKLQGRLNGFCAFSINYQYRIIFDFADDGIVRFYSIGSHKIYDQ